jgi:hypothetical protein
VHETAGRRESGFGRVAGGNLMANRKSTMCSTCMHLPLHVRIRDVVDTGNCCWWLVAKEVC